MNNKNRKFISPITKFIFYLKKPHIVLVSSRERVFSAEAIYQVLKQYFKVEKIQLKEDFRFSLRPLLKNEVFIIEAALEDTKSLATLFLKSKLPILVISDSEENPFKIREFSKILSEQGFLVANFDNKDFREITSGCRANLLSFGFQEGANLRATDIKLNGGTNFKINYKGNIVPVWLEKLFGKEQVYAALSAASVGIALGLNLVEISQALKSYHGLEKNHLICYN